MRRVDQYADGERQAPERHDVRRNAEHIHGKEGKQNSDRQCQNRYQSRAEVKQEYDDDKTYDGSFREQIALQGCH